MNPKTILVPFGGQDTELGALHTAFDLAEIYASHVEVWHVSPDPYLVLMMYAGPGMPAPYYDEGTVNDLKKHYEANKKEAKLKYLKLIKERGFRNVDKPGVVTEASASFHTATGYVEEVVSIRARLADLIVVSRTPKKGTSKFSEVIHNCLFKTGRPVLLVPPGKTAKKFNGKVAIAWNGSVEATHAVAFAMPYMEKGKAWIVTAMTDESKDFPLQPEDLAAHLERYGVETKTLWPDTKKSAAPQAVINAAKTVDASMIVMGAYTHSRVREIILGGMTEYMLKNADILVLLAH